MSRDNRRWPRFLTPTTHVEQASPSTPAAGDLLLFAKTDHRLYTKDSAGLERDVGAITLASLPSAVIDAIMPWVIEVDVFGGSSANTNWSTNSLDVGCLFNGKVLSSSVQNDEINFDLTLAAGTWSITIIYTLTIGSGIYTFTLGGASLTSLGGSVDTIDGYNSVTVKNPRTSITGIVVPTTAKLRLKIKMATKNASASSYQGLLQHITLLRTA